jgi:hypothetical protein
VEVETFSVCWRLPGGVVLVAHVSLTHFSIAPHWRNSKHFEFLLVTKSFSI